MEFPIWQHKTSFFLPHHSRSDPDCRCRHRQSADGADRWPRNRTCRAHTRHLQEGTLKKTRNDHILQCTLDISRSLFSKCLMRDTQISPVRVRYGCLLWVRSLVRILSSKLLYCVQYHAISYCDKSRVYSNYIAWWLMKVCVCDVITSTPIAGTIPLRLVGLFMLKSMSKLLMNRHHGWLQ